MTVPDHRHPALAALAAAGVVAGRVPDGVRVRDLSRAHPVWRVDLPDGPLVVKATAADGTADLGVEFLVYRLGAWCEPVRAVLPEPVLVDEDLGLLVLAHAGLSLAVLAGFAPQLGLAPVRVEADWLAGVAERLGLALGRVHAGTAGLPLPPARPPVALAGLSGRAAVAGPPGELCAALATEPVFADAAARLADPVAACLVSHDAKWDNVVVDVQGLVRLVDWELAGLGDPAVDLGFLLAEHLLRHAGRPDDAARALLRGYAAGARPRPGAVPVLARRAALAAGLRIGQLAVEVADTHPGAVAPLTDLARRVLGGADALTGEVSACLG